MRLPTPTVAFSPRHGVTLLDTLPVGLGLHRANHCKAILNERPADITIIIVYFVLCRIHKSALKRYDTIQLCIRTITGTSYNSRLTVSCNNSIKSYLARTFYIKNGS